MVSLIVSKLDKIGESIGILFIGIAGIFDKIKSWPRLRRFLVGYGLF